MNHKLRKMRGFFISDVIVLDNKFTLVLEQETPDGTVIKTVDIEDDGASAIHVTEMVKGG